MQLGLLFVIGLLYWIGDTIYLPVLPDYLADIGLSITTIGWLIGCSSVGLLAAKIPMARLSEGVGRRRVLLLGFLIASVVPILYSMVSSIPVLVAVRMLYGISLTTVLVSYDSIVLDLAPPSARGRYVGYMGLICPIGVAIGPAMGVLLQQSHGYGAVFLTSSLMGIAGLLLSTQIVEPEIVHPPGAAPTLILILTSRSILVPALIFLLGGITIGSVVAFLPLYVRAQHLDINIGIYYIVAAISSVFCRIVSGNSSDNQGRGPYVLLGLAAFCILLLLLSQASLPGLLLAAIFDGIACGTCFPALLSLIGDRSQMGRRTMVVAVSSTGLDLGISLSGPLLGGLLEHVNFSAFYNTVILIPAGAAILFCCFSNPTVSSSVRFALGRAVDRYKV